MSIYNLLLLGVMHFSPDDGGGSDDSGSKSDDSGEGAKKGADDKKPDPEVEKESEKRSKGKDAFDKRDWKRETTTEIDGLKEKISNLHDMVEGLAEVKKAESGDVEAKKIVEADVKGAAGLTMDEVKTMLTAEIDGIKSVFTEQLGDLTSMMKAQSLETQRRETLAELGVSESFLKSYTDGIFTLPDKAWDNSDGLVDTLNRMGAYPDDATDAKSNAQDSGSDRKSIGRRGSADDTGALHADGGSGADAQAAAAKLVDGIDKKFEKMEKTGGLNTEGLTSIFEDINKVNEITGTGSPM
jgi:hypothetical protein